MNKTDRRIIVLWYKGLTMERIAKRIGRPNDIDRVIRGLESDNIKNYEDENGARMLNNRRIIK